MQLLTRITEAENFLLILAGLQLAQGKGAVATLKKIMGFFFTLLPSGVLGVDSSGPLLG